MRKLATIRTISAINPINEADKIEKLTIDGWSLVGKKGEFKIGDLAVYFEIDSILPSSDNRFAFLKDFRDLTTDQNTIINGFKLRTIKLRGQVSQGLALPLSLFPECINCKKGDDVTELLNIHKYERPFNKDSVGIKANFPSFLSKTDQERCQNIINELDFNSNEKWEVTLKIDGWSSTYFYNNGKIGLCNRTCELINDKTIDTEYHFVDRQYSILNKLSKLKKNIAIQGEIYGNEIQGNRENLNEIKFAVFNIFDIDKYEYLTLFEALKLTQDLALDYVPILHSWQTFKELNITSMKDLLNFANVPSINNPVAEGVVFKSHDREYSFKVINNKFLLNEK
jgi:RNA ligase (TIGR02306 family)